MLPGCDSLCSDSGIRIQTAKLVHRHRLRCHFYSDHSNSQVHHPILDLSSAPLIPELRSEVTAGAAADIQRALITVAAVRAFPDQLAVLLGDLYLSVKAAGLTVIRLGVQLGIQNCFASAPAPQECCSADSVLPHRRLHHPEKAPGTPLQMSALKTHRSAR